MHSITNELLVGLKCWDVCVPFNPVLHFVRLIQNYTMVHFLDRNELGWYKNAFPNPCYTTLHWYEIVFPSSILFTFKSDIARMFSKYKNVIIILCGNALFLVFS